jgi:hypothetical protein
MIEQALLLEGYDVVVAHASEAWIEQAITVGESPVAILDVGYLTCATATDLLSHLRACCEAAHCRMPPLILLTTNPHMQQFTTCPVLLKPFHLRDLYHTVEQVRDGHCR